MGMRKAARICATAFQIAGDLLSKACSSLWSCLGQQHGCLPQASRQSIDGEDFELRQLAWTNLTRLLQHNPASASSQARSFFRCHVMTHPRLSANPGLFVAHLYSSGCMSVPLLSRADLLACLLLRCSQICHLAPAAPVWKSLAIMRAASLGMTIGDWTRGLI